ncbi:MAG: hypothetical protein ACREOZ_04925, partial [Gloeomargaritales cyanobacterium]
MLRRLYTQDSPVRRFKILGGNPEWYRQLVASLARRGATQAFLRGEPLSEKTVEISCSALKEMCLHLMKKNTAVAYESRCALTTLFHACGRGGEVSSSTWDSVFWDADNSMMVLDWRELKKAEESVMTLHPDRESFHLDQLHSFACYILSGQGRHDASLGLAGGGVQWMFPAYCQMANGGAASKVGRVITQCFNDSVPGVSKNMTSHGLRISSTDTVLFNFYVHTVVAFNRGNWDFKGDCLLFHYLTKKLHVATAGKALAGWGDPRIHVSSPTLDAFKTTANADCVESFCVELFAGLSLPRMLHNDLKLLRDVFVATLLMYRQDMIDVLGDDDIVLRRISRAVSLCNIR